MTATQDQAQDQNQDQAGPRPPQRVPHFHPLTVAAIETLTDDAVAVSFTIPDELADAYTFTAGQHITLRAMIDGTDVRRSYSICAPAGARTLRVAVKRLDGGVFSAWLLDHLRVGDRLDVMTPIGSFGTTFQPTAARRYVALAAGSGITPVLSILATALESEPDSSVVLVYGNRTSADVMFLDELADLKDRYPDRLQLLHVLSREQRESPLLSGRIDAEKLGVLMRSVLDPRAVDIWFVCGPHGMVETCQSALTTYGVRPDDVRTELFHVEDVAPRRAVPSARAEPGAEDASTILLTLDGLSTTVTMERDTRPVLDAVAEVRPDAPYSCRGGVCGTCRARCVVGEVEMERCYALEKSEIADGYVLTCQSYPVTDHVELDYDQ
ncbi:MAG TPA: 1,2-phenylacetyl-CoA epoxidase subunit PaaE [Jiangellaceae bacterium]|nr:1,2-phenylacetyl-CoA epoxidase subunit PaaE [Jiangellaceae bacterium]